MAGSKKSEAQLEKAIVENPDELNAHLAYADWQTQQGNPLGEFIRVQLALEDFKRPAQEREELAQREKEFLGAHGRVWLGDLAPFLLDQEGLVELPHWASEPPMRGRKYGFAFRRGWLAHLYVPVLTVEFSRALVKAREARMLENLDICGEAEETARKDFPAGKDVPKDVLHACYYPLLKCPYLGNVRRFVIGEWGSLSTNTSAELLVPLLQLILK